MTDMSDAMKKALLRRVYLFSLSLSVRVCVSVQCAVAGGGDEVTEVEGSENNLESSPSSWTGLAAPNAGARPFFFQQLLAR